MTLTKKLEAEIKKFMKTYWDTYLKGDLKTWATFLPADYKNIGGTEEEIWNSKKEILDYTKRVINQMVGQAEIRNTKTQIFSYDPYIMVHEFTEMFVKVDKKWTFYGKFRLSSIIQKMAGGWKVLHQHGSFPDSKAAEGEAFSVDQLKSENIKLLKAVKIRTMELEEKNRELEIQTSLEKVRAQALGMKKPEDLPNVCEVLFIELQALGFAELRNAMVNIHNDKKRTFVNYDYSDEIGKSITPLFYDIHPVIKKQIKKIHSADDAFSETVFKGKDLESWKVFRKSRGEKEDKRIKNSTALYYYFYSIGTGSIGISTFNAIPKEKKEVLKQFSNVFEFAYRRYMDVAQAEAQTRETQIELGLERVRARSMAMNNTSELQEVIHTVHQELIKLNIGINGGSFIAINSEIDKELKCWGSGGTADTSEEVKIPYYNKPFYTNLLKRIKKGAGFFTEAYSQQEKKKFFTHLFKHKPWSKLSAKEKKETLSSPGGYTRSCAVLKHTSIFIINHFGKIFSEEENNILIRFGKVFEQSYTRFLDLQKAEAQTREAQIELGLERVRARAMAMQHSDELAELVTVVFKELTQLDFHITSSIIWINNPESLTDTLWVTSAEMNQPARPIQLFPFQHPFFHSIIHAWKEKDPKWIYLLTGKEKSSFEKLFFKSAPGLPKALKSALTVPEKVVFSATFNNFGALELIGTEPLNDEKFDILHRFGKVFDSSYTRFNDLKKAEAQTREAKIEVAVERVRAKALAMHRSEDLHSVVVVLKRELIGLEIPGVMAATIYLEQDDGAIRILDLSTPSDGEDDPGLKLDKKFRIEDTDPKLWVRKIWEGKENYFVVETDEADFTRVVTFLRTIDKEGAEMAEKIIRENSIKKAWLPTVKLEKGRLNIDLLQPPTPEIESILLKMGAGFDLAYKRFLDLQKAEAQAREAQIELALERVRAGAMAMRQSDDLSKLIFVLYQELTKLDAKLDRCFIMIVNPENNGITWWLAGKEGLLAENGFFIPMNQHPSHLMYLDHWNKRKKKWQYLFEGKEKRDWDKFGFNKTELTKLPALIQKDMGGVKSIHLSGSSDQFGSLVTGSIEPLPEEQQDIISRFTIAFNQAYIRFLDLQKAEAQAREAQIELALERVRARTMAMQKSDELPEAANLLFQQVQSLGMPAWSAGYCIWNEDQSAITLWMSSEGVLQPPFTAPTTEDELFIEMRKGHSAGKTFHVVEMGGDKLVKHYQYMRTLPVVGEILDSIIEAGHPLPTFQIMHHAYFSKGFLLFITYEPVPDAHDIFKRFGKVFDQTYTRFLDLQKAEAQARVAKIEMALERVRSRSLAMHSSGELGEVVTVVLNNLMELGYIIDQGSAAHLAIFSEGTKDFVQWSADPALPHPVRTFIPYTDLPILTEFWDARQKGHDFFAKVYSFDEKNTWFNFAFEHSDLKHIPGELKKLLLECETYAHSIAIEKNSAIIINSITGNQLSENQIDILRRFSKVFEQAYVRFLDLQKAEAQAREAKIEAALERVRSKTMAMQRSEELLDASEILFVEMQKLGIESLTAGYVLMDKEEKNGLNYTPDPSTKKMFPVPVIIPHDETIHLKQIVKNWKKGKPFLIIEMDEDETIQHQTFIAERSTNFTLTAAQLIAISPGKLFLHNFYFKEGYLLIVGGSRLSEEQTNIMLRFTKVFQQTYTRFLDLQKAEAQAREAQIELGLERVRARAMAMQKSDELAELVDTVFKELTKLHFTLDRCIIIIVDEKSMSANYWMANPESKTPASYHLQLKGIPYLDFIYNSWKERKTKIVYDLKGDEKTASVKYIFGKTELKLLPDLVKEGMKNTDRVFLNSSFNNFGCLQADTVEPLSEDNLDIIYRFAKVFDLTYTRFNDLQKAEAQAREAQIELGLERVRARAMAMQKSDELSELVDTVFKELTKLDFALNWCIINIIDEPSLTNMVWAANPETNKPPESYLMKFEDYPFHHSMLKGYQERKPKHLYVIEGKEKTTYDNYLFNETEWRRVPKAAQDASRAMKRYVATFTFSNFGGLQTVGEEYLSEENLDILSRFGKVFDLTYTRFNDLQKAEAQAREAEIELALERVRARTMAMQHSGELQDTSLVLFQQLKELGEPAEQCTIGIIKESEGVVEISATLHGTKMQQTFRHKLDEPFGMSKIFKGWKDQHKTLIVEIKEDELQRYNQYRNELIGKETFPVNVLPGDRWIIHIAYFSKGMLALSTNKPRPAESLQLLERFAIVFEQTYTRFNDLQKAEAQAREAQIEAALERVRSRSMGMQKSDELKEVIKLVYQQLIHLNINLDHAGFVVDYTSKGDWTFWIADEQDIPAKITHPYFESVWATQFNEAKEKGADFFATNLNFEEKNKFYNELLSYVPGLPETSKDFYLNCPALAASTVLFDNISLYIENFSGTTYTDEDNNTLMRFGKVFQQTYTRFLDLQKAEAQNREAQINLAVERVRARALAMFKSEEILELVFKLKQEMMDLDIPNVVAATIHLKEKDGNYTMWDLTAMEYAEGKLHQPMVVYYRLEEVDPNLFIKRMWENTDSYFLVVQDEEDFKRTIQFLRDHDRKKEADESEAYLKNAGIKYGYHPTVPLHNGRMCIDLLEPPSDEIKMILTKMGAAFDLAYKRFEDLKNSEAQLREAQIEASLERVRSKAMSMQKSEDLANAVGIVFEELDKLNLGMLRCGIGIINKEKKCGQIWTTTKSDNNTVVQVSGDESMDVHPLLQGAFEAWLRQEADYSYILKGDDLNNYYKALIDEDFRLPDSQSLVTGTEGLVQYYYTAIFSSGGLFAFRETEFPEEAKMVLRRFAGVFNLTYTRFNDLKIAEAHAQQAEEDLVKLQTEKRRAEEALAELQVTQKQLIQSEKMASLGELTAGIAHEIQNPLNFVNNFSEVSKELLDEMREAIEKGDTEDAKEIMNDVIQNLEKINHHGKRADGIVKGMLQHSRSTNNAAKEPTDINALADEYLRLAYHGLRAKDKSFNATLKTDFDETIESINIIPQDIGRVILNLITNAFYVVNEKSKKGIAGYEPTVTITTSSIQPPLGGRSIQIKVSDNGGGIPQKVLEKIFQPFFTTKPTGQGTGLGLSLAYDIVKAHGGELKAETKEGVGSEFIIALPVN